MSMSSEEGTLEDIVYKNVEVLNKFHLSLCNCFHNFTHVSYRIDRQIYTEKSID